MDFTPNRNVPASARTTSAAGGSPANKKDAAWQASPGWLKIVWLVLLFTGAILVAAIVTLLIVGSNRAESELVEEDRYQAVFMDNNQVYFGKIRTINDNYLDLQGIYYLRVDQPVQPEQEGQQPQNITLQKLGCELHGPVDQMVINREHVTFWENLRSDGQVTKAIGEWLKQNPEGMKCDNKQTNNSNGGSGQEEGQQQEENQEEAN
jgi:hypothetical protein